jgi:major membrane immunogen (membrane-anchored lipoprotein)
MTKYLLAIMLPLIVASTGCKKKKDPLPTTMTFVMDKDTLWTTNNVVTDASTPGTVYITGTSKDGSQSLDIALTGFTGGKKTYTIDYRGTGGNITGNTGQYRNGSNSTMARTGKIVITEVANDVMKGTFDMYYLQSNFTGSFTAPLK